MSQELDQEIQQHSPQQPSGEGDNPNTNPAEDQDRSATSSDSNDSETTERSTDRSQNTDSTSNNPNPGNRAPSNRQPAEAGQEAADNPANESDPRNRPGQTMRSRSGLGGGDLNPATPRRFDPFDDPPEPMTGDDFLDWSDRLRDVEEMIADPQLRAEAARIRDRAKAIRKDIKRHSKEPNWDLIRLRVATPLVELQQHVRQELLRKSSDKSLVPIDRDPVPVIFQEAVRKYYEQLGTGR